MLLILLLLQVAIAEDGDLLVHIKNGALRGHLRSTTNGRQIQAFTAIPYAKPPVGLLRFQPPEPADNWTGVFEAVGSHPACIQREIFQRTSAIVGDEDCLYINVYTPDKSGKFPVMFFVHGGAWVTGTGKPAIYVSDVLLNQDVVLVVSNYRLGALGFFSSGDLTVPGNNGLKDQALALKWTKDNVEQFGGDPNSITVFGQSVGGASTHFFMFSPLTKGLFHRVISQSGTALCPWALSINGSTETKSRKLAKLFNCPTRHSQQMVMCLQNIPARSIVSKIDEFFEWDKDPLTTFKPVIEVEHEGAYLAEHPVDLLVKRNFAQVPWMLGYNTEDGVVKTSTIFGVPHLLEEYNQNLTEKIRVTGMYSDHALNPTDIASKIRKYYYGTRKVDETMLQNLTNVYTDLFLLCCANEAIYFHKKYSEEDVYYYIFGFKGATSWGELLGDTRERNMGVCHGDELSYLFPMPEAGFDRKVNSTEVAMRNVLTALWTNFAKHGNPTPTRHLADWQPVKTPDYAEYLFIGSPHELKMKAGFCQERANFWKTLGLNERVFRGGLRGPILNTRQDQRRNSYMNRPWWTY